MPMKDWSTTAANNDTAGSANFAEGQAPSTVNNSARQAMADVRAWYEDVEWRDWGHTPSYVSTTSFTVTGNQTAVYLVSRRIRMTDATALYGTIASVAYATVTTVTVTMDSGSLSASLTAVALGLTPATKSLPVDAMFSAAGVMVQRVEATPYTANAAIITAIPMDDTIPQNTEGYEILTVSITPTAAANRLVIEVFLPSVYRHESTTSEVALALFKSGSASAIAASNNYFLVAPTADDAGLINGMNLRHEMSATDTNSQTFTVRIGPNAGSVYLNGIGATRRFGGVQAARMAITEHSA